ncbi:hypothetical protein JCGZ_05902 [Jatropha curcas]|uniref:MYB family protein n=1 Tax=Jatropha curcas TaxID=180498 RepID=A0A067JBM5_JATCU|nr:transcription factor MYB62 isoform X1 [Jatropha curcas]AIT52246.1 MYB family protein [Jatropha curcas]KDP20133.1 hypothetical protein JCGZ_05902 [Jatropha curcas]
MTSSMSSLSKSISSSSSEDDAEQLRRGPWTLEEDSLLVHYIACHGEGRWNLLAKRAGLRRTGKSCRLRWLNYLKPDVKRGNLTPQEQLLILDLHSRWGNRWSKIAQHLPGRTDNEIKNYWRTRVQKQARHLKVDANSRAFQDIIRYFWMPRLIQKIEGSSSSSVATTVSENPTISQSINCSPHDLLLPTAAAAPAPPPLPQEISCQGGLDHNSDSNSCISSAESINMSRVTEYPNGYYVDSICYNIGPMSLPTMSDSPAGDRHLAESDWVGYDFEENTWTMDEFMAI